MKLACVWILFSLLCATFVNVVADPSPAFPLDIGAFIDSIPSALSFTQNHLKNFWQGVEKKGPQAAEQLLGQVTKTLPEITHKVNDFRDSINKVIDQARNTHNEIQQAIKGKGITMDDISTLLSREVENIYEDLKDEVDDPSTDDHARRSEVPRDRTQLVSQIMEKIGIAYIRVLTGVGVSQDIAETQFNDFSSTVTPFLLIAGRIIDKYPFLLTIIVAVVSMFLPELPLLRLLLGLFGFGPLGPVKGSIAAWAQRVMWGAAVAPGSFFSILQRLGMTI